MNPYSPENFFDFEASPAREFLQNLEYVWDGVGALPDFIEKTIEPRILGVVEEGAWLEPGRVQLGDGSLVQRGAIIYGPSIIGRNTVIRSGALLRGHVMVGDDCVIGHGTELRQVLVLNEVRIPHLSAILTSLLGNRVWIAGNAHTANFRLDGEGVVVHVPWNGTMQPFPTDQKHFGAVVGDDSKVGTLAVLQPGTIVGQRCTIYPMCSASGYIPHDSLVVPKHRGSQVITRARRPRA
jgi:UDP-N-acetylglucosamine diphosphorylase / glucose-1-phosphate thymidylyltransferase / UDP-N-acetylgalactosamine diphosphorylase / glucosamine-1-phosphate N-acetyltransferase / galactosamine-1-phosphate N-acetyltransferase